MRLRSFIFPRCIRDWILFLIVVVFVPYVYLVEVTLVLPYFHRPDSWANTLHFFVALFAVTNISCNFMGIILLDTSVPKDHMSSEPKPKWEYCASCEKYAPPRSWHCTTCQTCILKRDHHCLFAGCCVGHYNIRFFIMFLVYLCLSCLYALVYNIIFFYQHTPIKSLASLLKWFCPMYTLLFQMDTSTDQIFMLSFLLTFIGFGFSGILLSHHLKMVLSGKVTHERTNNYDFGWRKNLECALGHNWRWAWFFPLVESRLPHDGMEWVTSFEALEMNKKTLAKNC